VFRRNQPEEAADGPQDKPGGKGRPTPTRKEAEAARKARAKAPRTRREQMQRQRELRGEQSRKIRRAMKEGDERYFLPRDQGPVRRFVRDFVDVRLSIVEMLIPLLIISMIMGWVGGPGSALSAASTMVLLLTILFVVLELVVLRFRLRGELRKRFPEEDHKGTTFYASMRALQMKFMRMPKSRVKVGQALPDDYT
jgi:hypothetical protein